MSAYRSATERMTSVGSRCVITNRASGNARSSGVEQQHVRRAFEPPGSGRLPPLQQLHHPTLVAKVEVRSASRPATTSTTASGRSDWKMCDCEIQRHQVVAFHRAMGVAGNVVPRADHLALVASGSADPPRPRSTAAGTAARTPTDAGSGRRDLGQQHRQRRRAGAGQSHADQRRDDRHRRRSRGAAGTSPRPAAAAPGGRRCAEMKTLAALLSRASSRRAASRIRQALVERVVTEIGQVRSADGLVFELAASSPCDQPIHCPPATSMVCPHM